MDQNKWIDLAYACENPDSCPQTFEISELMKLAKISGKAIFPLAATNILETYKMQNAKNKAIIAEVQAYFSGGIVFRNRNYQIKCEILKNLANYSKEKFPKFNDIWFLSNIFIDAFADSTTLLTAGYLEQD